MKVKLVGQVKSEELKKELKIKKLKDLCNNPNYWDEMFSSNGKLSKELIRSKNIILIHIDHILEFGKDCNEKGKVEARRDLIEKVERTKHNLLSFLETVFPELDEIKTSETDKSVMEIIKSYFEELEKELKP